MLYYWFVNIPIYMAKCEETYTKYYTGTKVRNENKERERERNGKKGYE